MNELKRKNIEGNFNKLFIFLMKNHSFLKIFYSITFLGITIITNERDILDI